MLDSVEKQSLLTLARTSIGDRLSGDGSLHRALAEIELTPRLREPGATFVTLAKPDEEEEKRLRGCIGTLTAHDSLYRDVIDNSVKSAFEDPRFPPVGPAELPMLTIDVSVLTPMRRIENPGEIVIGRDGVRLEKGTGGSVFLPQVAVEQRWDTARLLEQLALKAGLPRDGWRGGELFVFQADVFSEVE